MADKQDDPAGNFWAFSDDVRTNWLPEAYDDRALYFGMTALQTGAQMRAAIQEPITRAGYTYSGLAMRRSFVGDPRPSTIFSLRRAGKQRPEPIQRSLRLLVGLFPGHPGQFPSMATTSSRWEKCFC